MIREAVAYGDEDEKLMVWYKVEDMHAVMRWIIPEESPWVNSRKWVNEYKRYTNSKKSERQGRRKMFFLGGHRLLGALWAF